MKKKVSIIGGGASSLTLACMLDNHKFETTVYDQNYAIGRKFLVAGDGGLNITHSEPLDLFKKKYIPPDFMDEALNSFTNVDLRNYLLTLGIDTFVGSSKRVFPIKGIKPIQVLNAFMDRMKENQVTIKTGYQWKGWNLENDLLFEHKGVLSSVQSDLYIFALGGASWRVTGSDGHWMSLFEAKQIKTTPFKASNCSYLIAWDPDFIAKYEGTVLKNIEITCGNLTKKGEVVITKTGIEGGAIYALSSQIRSSIELNQIATIFIDLKPSLNEAELHEKWKANSRLSHSEILRKVLKLPEAIIGLIKLNLTKEAFLDQAQLISIIKKLPLTVVGPGPIDEAISTVGGISLEEINSSFELVNLPNHYVIGEMLDWDAPTGGYLLQGCLSMGAFVAQILNKKY